MCCLNEEKSFFWTKITIFHLKKWNYLLKFITCLPMLWIRLQSRCNRSEAERQRRSWRGVFQTLYCLWLTSWNIMLVSQTLCYHKKKCSILWVKLYIACRSPGEICFSWNLPLREQWVRQMWWAAQHCRRLSGNKGWLNWAQRMNAQV